MRTLLQIEKLDPKGVKPPQLVVSRPMPELDTRLSSAPLHAHGFDYLLPVKDSV